MPRYRLDIEYFGPFFKGFQRQKDLLTVQGALEHIIHLMTQERVTLMAAGRTDSGVHAINQVVHFDLCKVIDDGRFLKGLNHYINITFKTDYLLPLWIKKLITVDDSFHARFSARKRRYLYKIIPAHLKSTHHYMRVLEYIKPLDLSLMTQGAQMFVGHHNFDAFRSKECQSRSPLKTIDLFEIKQVGEEIHIWVEARSFLHHQVRLMVGALLDVASKRFPMDIIQEMLMFPPTIRHTTMAPAHGLYFYECAYVETGIH
jgi:tRNA pseudouridine38-40 synthase